MSAYLILELNTDLAGETAHHGDNVWRECGIIAEPSAEAAVRAYVKTTDARGGVFLAIPERSAKTIRVKVETVQKVSVDAGNSE